jgi:hypothetical protein
VRIEWTRDATVIDVVVALGVMIVFVAIRVAMCAQ